MKRDDTRQALADALMQLLQKKRITRITIAELTEMCGISRMTFYYHFRDIYDLAEWALQESLRGAIRGNCTYDTWHKGFLSFLEALQAQKSLVLNTYFSVDQLLARQSMHRDVMALLLPVIEEQAEGIPISPEGKEQVAGFYAHALMGVVTDWVQGHMVSSPQEVVQTTSTILRGDFRNSLENMSRLEHHGASAPGESYESLSVFQA